jgi:hypothetical protein
MSPRDQVMSAIIRLTKGPWVFPAGRPVQEVEGISVKWINTNGLSLLGPGSEWFWTALSTVAVVVSLLAIYRQIRLQTDVKETQQLNDLAKDWESERIQRLRLAVFLGIKEGKPVREIAAAWRIAGFWEVMGGLAQAGHVSFISDEREAIALEEALRATTAA